MYVFSSLLGNVFVPNGLGSDVHAGWIACALAPCEVMICPQRYRFVCESDGACLSVRSEKNSLNIKFLGGIFLGNPGPRRRDIPDKNCMQLALFCCFRQGVAGMSRDLGRDVPDLEKLYARKLWANFSYPRVHRVFVMFLRLRFPPCRQTIARLFRVMAGGAQPPPRGAPDNSSLAQTVSVSLSLYICLWCCYSLGFVQDECICTQKYPQYCWEFYDQL